MRSHALSLETAQELEQKSSGMVLSFSQPMLAVAFREHCTVHASLSKILGTNSKMPIRETRVAHVLRECDSTCITSR